MKKILLLFSLLISIITSYSQPNVFNSEVSQLQLFEVKSSKSDTSNIGTSSRFSVVTPKKDTLFLLNCDLGQLVYTIWNKDPKYKGHTPVIILIEDLTYYERKYNYSFKN